MLETWEKKLAAVRERPMDFAGWVAAAQAAARMPAAPACSLAAVPFSALFAVPELAAAALRLAGLESLDGRDLVRHRLTQIEMRWLPAGEYSVGPPGIQAPARVVAGGIYLATAPLTRDQARGLGLRVRWLENEGMGDGARVAAGVAAGAVSTAAASVGLRLPSERELEAAARAGDDRPFPWGHEPGLLAAEDMPAHRMRSVLPPPRELWPAVGTWPRMAGPFGHQMLAGPLLEPAVNPAGRLRLRGSAACWTRRARSYEVLDLDDPHVDPAWIGARLATGAPPAPGAALGPVATPPPLDLFQDLAWPKDWATDGVISQGSELLTAELAQGLAPVHRVLGYPARLVASSEVPDDHLFLFPGSQPMLARVWLAGSAETAGTYPGTQTFESLDDFLRWEG